MIPRTPTKFGSSFSANTQMTRAIFLDFDGVFHPSTAIEAFGDAAPSVFLAQKHGLMRWTHVLAELLDGHADVILMVHSSWRHYLSNSDMRILLGPDLEPMYDGFTDPQQRGRLASILAKVDQGIDQYLILDDAKDEFPEGCAELVLCNPLRGIEDPEVKIQVANWLSKTRPCASQDTVLDS